MGGETLKRRFNRHYREMSEWCEDRWDSLERGALRSKNGMAVTTNLALVLVALQVMISIYYLGRAGEHSKSSSSANGADGEGGSGGGSAVLCYAISGIFIVFAVFISAILVKLRNRYQQVVLGQGANGVGGGARGVGTADLQPPKKAGEGPMRSFAHNRYHHLYRHIDITSTPHHATFFFKYPPPP